MAPKADPAPPPPETVEGPEAADRFRKLTRDLLTVSKKDLDEARAREVAPPTGE